MTVADIPAVYAIEKAAYADPWPKQTFHDGLHVGFVGFVIEEEQQILGYTLLSTGADEAHILNIAIDPKLQRQGYATQLVQHVLQWAIENTIVEIYLEVRVSNIAAIQLYEAAGFSQSGVRKDYYKNVIGREDALIMMLVIPRRNRGIQD